MIKRNKNRKFNSNENAEMVLNNNKQIKHHTDELPNAIKGKNVPAWVVAKVNRSASDLSDATHYMEGQNNKYRRGGFMYEIDKRGEKLDIRDRLFTANNIPELKKKLIEKYGSLEGISASRKMPNGAFAYVKLESGGMLSNKLAKGGGVPHITKIVAFPEHLDFKYYVIGETDDKYIVVNEEKVEHWKNANVTDRYQYFEEELPKGDVIVIGEQKGIFAKGGGVDEMKQLWFVTNNRDAVKNISTSIEAAEVFLASALKYDGKINYVKVPLKDWVSEKVNVGNIRNYASSFWKNYANGGGVGDGVFVFNWNDRSVKGDTVKLRELLNEEFWDSKKSSYTITFYWDMSSMSFVFEKPILENENIEYKVNSFVKKLQIIHPELQVDLDDVEYEDGKLYLFISENERKTKYAKGGGVVNIKIGDEVYGRWNHTNKWTVGKFKGETENGYEVYDFTIERPEYVEFYSEISKNPYPHFPKESEVILKSKNWKDRNYKNYHFNKYANGGGVGKNSSDKNENNTIFSINAEFDETKNFNVQLYIKSLKIEPDKVKIIDKYGMLYINNLDALEASRLAQKLENNKNFFNINIENS